MLGHLFPPGAFAAGGPRLTAAIASRTRTIGDFMLSWASLQSLVQHTSVSGPLDHVDRDAGSGRIALRGLQRAVTTQVEQVLRDELHDKIAVQVPPGALPCHCQLTDAPPASLRVPCLASRSLSPPRLVPAVLARARVCSSRRSPTAASTASTTPR